MSTYLQLHDGWKNHPKIRRLCLILGDLRAWSYPVALWEWATKYAQDGDLTRHPVADLETACDWGGAEGALVEALVSVRLVDRADGGGLRIHDWADWGGQFFVNRAKEAARKRAIRAGGVPRTTADVRRTVGVDGVQPTTGDVPRTTSDVHRTNADQPGQMSPGDIMRVEEKRRETDPEGARAGDPGTPEHGGGHLVPFTGRSPLPPPERPDASPRASQRPEDGMEFGVWWTRYSKFKDDGDRAAAWAMWRQLVERPALQELLDALERQAAPGGICNPEGGKRFVLKASRYLAERKWEAPGPEGAPAPARQWRSSTGDPGYDATGAGRRARATGPPAKPPPPDEQPTTTTTATPTTPTGA